MSSTKPFKPASEMTIDEFNYDDLEKDLNGWKTWNPSRNSWIDWDNNKVIQSPPPRIRYDLLYKLRWDLFGSLEDIQVCDVSDNNEITLVPLQDHPLASERLITVPYKRLHVYAGPV